MAPTITSINLNEPSGEQTISQPDTIQEETIVETPNPLAEAPNDEIDTDELEGLLSDLKATKKRNKLPPKTRIRKPKAIAPEPEPIIEPVVEPTVEPVAEQTVKSKRKYVRKPRTTTPEAVHVPIPEPAVETTQRSTGNLIEEMQRAERALRYQMRKNKMQTLVSQAF